MFSIGNNCEVNVFTEPKPVIGEATFMEKVREKGKGKKYEAEVGKKSEERVDKSSEARFEKNDANRCMMVCKDKKTCNYIVLCSVVLTTTTFRIKTLFDKHKCGIKLFNKSAKAEWVANVIVDGLKNNTKMKLNEVVADV